MSQGFADFYDHRKPVVKKEQLEAIDVYTKLLPFIEKWGSSWDTVAGDWKYELDFDNYDQFVWAKFALVTTKAYADFQIATIVSACIILPWL